MKINISTSLGIISATLDEELEEIQTESPVCSQSSRVEIKYLGKLFYVTTLSDLLNEFGSIEIKKRDKINASL